MRIIRVWLYKVTELAGPMQVWPVRGNGPAERQVYGEFKYFAVDGEKATKSCRREAKAYERLSGQKVETTVGYPDFMVLQGYSV